MAKNRGVAKPSAKAGSEDTIYVRIDPDIREWLRGYAQGKEGLSERLVIERLLMYLQNLDETERDLVLSISETPLGSVGAAIESMSWGQHAFDKHRWLWAVEAFYNLTRIAPNSPGFQRLSRYKMGFVWGEIALNLRTEALDNYNPDAGDSGWDEYYKTIDDVLCLALLQNKKFLGLAPKLHHPVVRYNNACTWALRMQFAVERVLTPSSGLLVVDGEARDEDKCWEEFGKKWRKSVEEPKARTLIVEKVKSYANQVMKELARIILDKPSKDNGDGFVAPSDSGFLMDLCRSDSDLRIMRVDPELKGEFFEWVEKHSTKESRLEATRKIIELVQLDDELTEARRAFG